MKLMIEHIPERVIPAHDEVTKLYKFDELDEEVSDRLLSECARVHADDWEDEWRKTLKALEELFGVKCKDWNVDDVSHDYTLYAYCSTYTHIRLDEAADCADRDDPDYYYLGLSGVRAMGKCWTLYGRETVKSKHICACWTKATGGEMHYGAVGGHHTKGYHSKVLFDGLHDGTCPLTGYCGDNDGLDPLWDMMEGKHAKDGTTIADMIDQCFEAFFTAWQKDIEWRMSEEYFRENEMVDWYDADGNEVDVPEGATLEDPKAEEVA